MADILFLAHRIPFPPDRGDKIRAFHMLKHLAQRHRVHLVSFADEPADLAQEAGLDPYTASRATHWRGKRQAVAGVQALWRGQPISITAFGDAGVRKSVEALLPQVDCIFVFSGQMAQYLPATATRRSVMDFVDMDSAKFAAYAEAGHGPKSWMFAREARLLEAIETQVAAKVDASLFVSEAEAALFREKTGAQRVGVIENGIDTAFFDPSAAFAAVDAPAPLIVFTGQMDYRPNIEGVRWFAEAVLPLIRARHLDAHFAIVGRKPAEAVRALAKLPGVIVTGEVPDVRGWLAAASVVVAPLKLARGVQNKVLEAMAMARPVVASAPAAEGIDHDGTIAVAQDEAEMAEAVGRYLNDPDIGALLGAAARERVEARYSWAAQLAPLDRIIERRTA